MAYGTASVASPVPLPGAAVLGSFAGTLGNLGFSLVLPFTFLLFPDGKLPSPRWRPVLWLAIANSALGLLALFRPGPVLDAPYNNALGIEALGPVLNVTKSVYEGAAIALLALAPVATIVRYRGAALDERLRIKWLAWAAGAIVAVLVFGQGLTFFVQPTSALWQLLLNVTWLLVNVLIITSIAVAILAHRLYDVDVVIRKTMVYSVVTLILTLVFLGLVILGQRLLMTLTGEASPVAIVASTLAVAALFSPLRRRVQDFVDRRFYRRKYDAQQVLAQFATVARDETDIEELSAALVGVVRDNLQLATAGIWLNPSGGKR